MKTQPLVLLMLVASLVMFAAPSAQACDNNGGYGWGYDYGYLYNSLDYNVPYFAAHPPVYYSYPVPRTYGYSPFAYPPYVMTPEVAEEVKPVEIVNPYVPNSQQQEAKEQVDRSADAGAQPQPLVILNPFVSAKGAVAQSQ
jgi:hypothetical protein